jgi:hypothetical protein
MNLVWLFLGGVLVILVAFLGLLRVAKRWINEGLELESSGIETTAVVTAKIVDRRSHYIKYQYTDQFGRRHQRKVMALPDIWDSTVEQGPISIVYSEKRPHISAPKQFVELMRERRNLPRRG